MSRCIVTLALSSVLLAGGFALAYRAIPETQIFAGRMSLEERIVCSTVMLMDAAKFGGGSGVLVRHDGRWYCWTAAHVAESAAVVTVRFFDQGVRDVKVEGKVVRTVAIDVELDLAFLELDIREVGQLSAVLGREELQLGREVINCGHSGLSTAPWNVVRGNVSSVTGDIFKASTISYPGCSGSGIWTLDGKLVGVVSSWAGPGLTGFIDNGAMTAFAKANRIEWVL